MKIKWLGHSCFLLSSSSGVRVLTDPFNEKVGYKLPAVEADIVTTSHGHGDHNYPEIAKGSFTIISNPGRFNERGIEITGIPTFHDDVQGAKRGNNIVYKFNIDGINVCHCGDLGHLLSGQQAQEIGKVDILMVPVGGFYTVDHLGAAEVIKLLQPKIILPMHYKTKLTKSTIESVDEFLTTMGDSQRLDRQEIEITIENMDELAGVLVLNYE